MEVTITKCKCLKCKHEWIPRVEHKPKECPNCKCYNFDKENEKDKPKDIGN